MTDYKLSLSTTEANNHVGLIKIRQDDVNSQILDVTSVTNNKPTDITGLLVFFKTKWSDGSVIKEKVLDIDYESSSFKFTMTPNTWQKTGPIDAWFSFERPDRTIVDSTKNFRYTVFEGDCKDIPQGNYIYEFEEIMRKAGEIFESGDFAPLLDDIETLSLDKADRLPTKKSLDNLELTKAERLPTEKRLSELQQDKADQVWVDSQLSVMVSGAPKGTFSTLAALTAKYPTGTSGVFLVFENNHSYSWNAETKKWQSLGPYQSNQLADGSVTESKLGKGSTTSEKLARDSVTKEKVSNTSITPLRTNFLKFTDEEVFDSKLNENGGLEPSNGTDTGLANFIRSGYYDISDVKRLKFVDDTKTWSGQYVFLYKEKGQNGYRIPNPTSVITPTSYSYTYNLPEGYKYMRTLLKGSYYDVTNSLSILLSNTEYNLDLRENADILKNEFLDDYFLNKTVVRIKNENLYDYTKSVEGGLDNQGKDASINGYTRSEYINIEEGFIYYYQRSNLTAQHSNFCFLYKEKGSIGQPISGVGAEFLETDRAFKFTVPADYRFLRFTDSSPTSSAELMPSFKITENIYEKPTVVVKDKDLSKLYYRRDEPLPLPAPGTGSFYPRPDNGVVNFDVKLNVNPNGIKSEDEYIEYTDDGVLFLPTNYDPVGKVTPLIISCHGAGTTITPGTTSLSEPVGSLVRLGYAVLDMNGIPKSMSGNTGLHFGSPTALQSYLKGYSWVVKRYNVKKEVFVVGTSMGGLSSMMLVQSGAIPIIAQGAFCPVTDHFKQAYSRPWAGAIQRPQIAKFFGFEGAEPTWTTTRDPSEEEIGYYMTNIDKVIGFNPMQKNVINWKESKPYDFLSNQIAHDTQEKAAYDKLVKLHSVPLKIWHNDDDPTVLQKYSDYFVNAINNSGGLASLRTFPTGGHNAWDNGSRVTVTDVNGSTFTMGTSGYELELWFRRFDDN